MYVWHRRCIRRFFLSFTFLEDCLPIRLAKWSNSLGAIKSLISHTRTHGELMYFSSSVPSPPRQWDLSPHNHKHSTRGESGEATATDVYTHTGGPAATKSPGSHKISHHSSHCTRDPACTHVDTVNVCTHVHVQPWTQRGYKPRGYWFHAKESINLGENIWKGARGRERERERERWSGSYNWEPHRESWYRKNSSPTTSPSPPPSSQLARGFSPHCQRYSWVVARRCLNVAIVKCFTPNYT